MHLTPEVSVSALAVFAQGLLSFFSPCVFPIIPLYIGYLSGSARQADDPSEAPPSKGRLLVNTCFFILGISFAFFLLALGFTAFGQSFRRYSGVITKVGGALVFLLGLYQLDLFGAAGPLSRERRLHLSPETLSAGPLAALLMGFTFSFGWTPCVGPALTSALLLASSSSSAAAGFVLVGVYTVGFTLPFLCIALFAQKAMGFFSGKGRLMTAARRLGGVLLIVMGVLMFTGYFGQTASAQDTGAPAAEDTQAGDQDDRPRVAVPDAVFTDRDGTPVSLTDYAGQTVFLNFWATWCGPCKNEMPDIQALYEAYGCNEGSVAVVAVAMPDTYQEGSAADICDFLDRNGYTYPVLFDRDGAALELFGVTAFPTTFMIDAEGFVYGYISGAMDYATMVRIVEETAALTDGEVQP